MKVHVILLGSPIVVTVDLPEGVGFVHWVKMVKADGGIFSDQLYIAHDKIIGMGTGDVIKHQTAPSTDVTQ